MKKVLFLVLLFAVPIFAQRAINWGDGFKFYSTRYGTYNEKVRTEVTTLGAADTIYTKLLDMGGDALEGVYNVSFSSDSIDAPSSAVQVEVHFYKKDMSPNYRWSPWYPIFVNAKTDTLYDMYILRSDSTWHKPANGRQYRIYRTDVAADTLTPYLADYLR